MTDTPRKPTTQGIRSGLWLLDPLESKPDQERRRGPYSRRALGLRRSSSWTEIALIVGLLTLAMVLLPGCVTTELTSAGVTISRTSVLSDVELEASIDREGRMSIRERQGQAVAEGLAGALPGVGL